MRESLKMLEQTNESLLEPIKFEMEFLQALESLDGEIQKARQHFMQTLSLQRIEHIL